MSLFYRDIKKRLEKHIKELEKYLGFIPDDWLFWWDHHKKEIKYIKFLDNKIINDIVKLHKSKERDNLNQLAQQLLKDLQLMEQQVEKQELAYEVQKEEAVVVNNIIKKIGELDLEETLKVLEDNGKTKLIQIDDEDEAYKFIRKSSWRSYKQPIVIYAPNMNGGKGEVPKIWEIELEKIIAKLTINGCIDFTLLYLKYQIQEYKKCRLELQKKKGFLHLIFVNLQ